MSSTSRWKRFWSPSVALAFDRERMWSVDAIDDSIHSTATRVAFDPQRRKVVAVGDAAVQLLGQESPRLVVSDYIRDGAISNADLAEAAIRYELRQRVKGWRMTPRVLVATLQNDTAKRIVRDVMLHAGARDVIVIPILMAGALGAGLDVASDRASTVFMLDRDWAGFAVIRSSAIVVSQETAGGVEQMLEDVAAGVRTKSHANSDLAALHADFRKNGIEANAGDQGHIQFVRRWRERFSNAILSLPDAVRNNLQRKPLCLIGPYAEIPGLKELFTAGWEWETVVPREAERAVILGCGKVLGELGQLMKSAK